MTTAKGELALHNRMVFSTAEIARELGWRTERVRRRLVAAGAVFKFEPGKHKHYYTSRDHVLKAFPEVGHRIIASMLTDE